MNIHVASKAAAAKWSTLIRGKRKGVGFAAPLAIHNTIYHKKTEAEYGSSNERSRRQIVSLIVLIIVCTVGQTWFLHVPHTMKELHAERPADESCHFEGKKYSIGSSTTMADGVVRVCTDAPADAPSFWGRLIEQ